MPPNELKLANSATTSPTTAAPPASIKLLVNSHAKPPATPPVATAPSLRPKMLLNTFAPIGTAKNKNTAKSVHCMPAKPWLDCPDCFAGSGRFSPLMRAMI